MVCKGKIRRHSSPDLFLLVLFMTYTQSRPQGGQRRKFTSKPSFKRGGASGGARFRSGGSSSSRFGGGGRARGGASRGRRGAFAGAYIDPSKFINKAQPVAEGEAYVPQYAFNDFAIDQTLKQAISKKGYTTPTPIQDQAIPHVLSGRDVVGIANTGTGKTASFLIPLIHMVRTNAEQKILILVPTRELALQIDAELKGLTRGMRLFSVCLVGGAPIGKQLAMLKYPNQFIIGTPGRVKDLIERKKVRLSDFTAIVLDEADRMLDMGFVNDMRFVMAGMPKEHQTLFFSATMSKEIEKLISEFLKNPVHISVKTRDTAHNVEQDVVRCGSAERKLETLQGLLAEDGFHRVLVFGQTKHGVEKLSKALAAAGFKSESIHGNKTHSRRQQALRAFKEGRVQILVATDVAARGLDIDDVSHVINYDLPMTYDDYVHRIGRTGRGDKRGTALTFIH